MRAKFSRATGEGAVRVGISACLLGREVRFDGGHKHDPFLTEVLGRFVEWVPVCPEVELGLGIPREPIRIERDARGLHLVASRSGRDLTLSMQGFAARRVQSLQALALSGYVLKKDSPSCGMERVPVYDRRRCSEPPRREGRGFFAEALRAADPLLPVEEEGRLRDPQVRENFVVRVFAYGRLRSFFAGRWTRVGLLRFHSAHKFTLLAHAPGAYQRLHRFLAQSKGMPRAKLHTTYASRFMHALSQHATPQTHANVMEQIVGHLEGLKSASRAELTRLIGDYRRGLRPRLSPITRIRKHLRQKRRASFEGEIYLEAQELLL